MDNTTIDDAIHVFYDAELIRIEEGARLLVFHVGGCERIVRSNNAGWWEMGTIGRLVLCPEPDRFMFYSYPDQRLRRAPERDEPTRDRWGWRIGEHRFCVRAGVVPGKSGAIVREDIDKLNLDIPREFVSHCARYELTPASVLRAFVADLCELESCCSRPREDGYSSNGHDERFLAREYFNRAYGWRESVPSIEKPAIAPDFGLLEPSGLIGVGSGLPVLSSPNSTLLD